ncbi:MAG: DNA recombination protein RmuC, partial [Bacteroidales bacterium]|nr:DNA recombination protein RmuC [Bacteroidales bacterium]
MNTILIAIIAFLAGGGVAALLVHNISRKGRQEALAIKDEELLTKENEAASLRNEVVELRISEANLTKEIELLRESAAENQKKNKEQLHEQIEALKLAFGESAQKIFEEKSKSLSQANEKDLKTLLDPLKEKMEEFRNEVKDSKEKSIKNSASLEEQIKVMMERAATLGQEANNLATALKGNNKVQGNWGETHLEKLLQDYGFVEGIDYVKQELVRDSANQAVRNEETGRKMIPDFTLTFPDKTVVVIDSKVSFTAYLDYCNADD